MKPNLENNLDNKNVKVNQESFAENKSGSKFLDSMKDMSKIEQNLNKGVDLKQQQILDNQLSQEVKNLDPAGRAAYEKVLNILIENNISNPKQFFIGENGKNLKYVKAFSKYNTNSMKYEPDSVLLKEMTGDLKNVLVENMKTEYTQSKLGKASYEFNISDENLKKLQDGADQQMLGLYDKMVNIWNPNSKMTGKEFANTYLGTTYAQNQ